MRRIDFRWRRARRFYYIFLGGTDVAFLHVHARGLFIRRISLFTRGALSLRQCVSAWLFTLAEHEKVENV